MKPDTVEGQFHSRKACVQLGLTCPGLLTTNAVFMQVRPKTIPNTLALHSLAVPRGGVIRDANRRVITSICGLAALEVGSFKRLSLLLVQVNSSPLEVLTAPQMSVRG